MQEQGPKNIELSELPNQVQKIQEQVKGLKDVIIKGFSFDLTVIGNLLIGKKEKIGSDGKTEEVPWTMDELMEEMEKSRKEQLVGIRQDLARDTIIVINSQERFFSAIEHPLKNDSANNSAFLLALLERVLSSKDKIGERYPVGEPTEEYWTAELLEVIRRTVLKPTTYILEGYGRSGIHSVPGYEEEEFWEGRQNLITDQMKNALKEDDKDNMDNYHKLEKEREKRALESRGENEWEEVLKRESFYLNGYLSSCIKRGLQKAKHTEDFAQRATYQGKKIASEQTLIHYRQTREKVQSLADEFKQLKNFQEVLPWIKKNFGEDADFQTLLQFLNPIELALQK